MRQHLSRQEFSPMLTRPFYGGELWKRELENILMPMPDRYDVVLVEDPEGQVRW
jgi:hypothetical protein